MGGRYYRRPPRQGDGAGYTGWHPATGALGPLDGRLAPDRAGMEDIMRRISLGVATAVLCAALSACSHAPVPPATANVEADYKTSYQPPAGYGRVYIFQINQRVFGRDHLKTTDVYLGKEKAFISQISDGEFGAFDVKAGTILLTVKWANVMIIEQPVDLADGATLFIKPDWDKRPGVSGSFSPLFLFGAIGGAIYGATAEQSPGSYDTVAVAEAMKEIQALHLASIAPEARSLVRQEASSETR